MSQTVLIIGGGAAGMLAALTALEGPITPSSSPSGRRA